MLHYVALLVEAILFELSGTFKKLEYIWWTHEHAFETYYLVKFAVAGGVTGGWGKSVAWEKVYPPPICSVYFPQVKHSSTYQLVPIDWNLSVANTFITIIQQVYVPDKK